MIPQLVVVAASGTPRERMQIAAALKMPLREQRVGFELGFLWSLGRLRPHLLRVVEVDEAQFRTDLATCAKRGEFGGIVAKWIPGGEPRRTEPGPAGGIDSRGGAAATPVPVKPHQRYQSSCCPWSIRASNAPAISSSME